METKLWKEHQEVLKVRAISIEYAWACGLRSWSGAAAKQKLADYGINPKGEYPGLPLYEHGTGIEIPYMIEAHDRVSRCRIRLDNTSIEVSDDTATRSHGTKTVALPRYVAQAGVPVVPYFPPWVRLEVGGELVPWDRVRRDTTIALYITEAPLKALALSDHGLPALGLGGVLAGPHVTAETLAGWGDVDPRSIGSTLRPSPDLASVDWRGREAIITFDANLLYRPMVALGASRLAFLLEGLGARVQLIQIPLRTPHDVAQLDIDVALSKTDQDQGPDDYLFTHKLAGFRALEPRPANPVEMIRMATDGLTDRSPERRERIGALLETLYVRAYCHVRGDAYVTTHLGAAVRPSFKVSEIKAAVKDFRAAMAEGAKTEKEEQPVYTIKDGRLFCGDVDLADFAAKIEEEVIADDGHDRTRVFKISGELAGGHGLPTIEVDASDFHKMEWVATLWGARASMRARRWQYVAEGIQKLSEPKVSVKYVHFGWRDLEGKRAFLLPGGAITQEGCIDLEVDAPGKLSRFSLTPYDPESPLTDLLWSLSILDAGPLSVTVPGLLAVYMAPLVDMLGPTFVMWLHGPSGNAKSTFASLLQSHYGDFTYKTLPETWASTVNAIEATLWRAKDVLLTVDNFVPPQSSREQQDHVSKAVRLIQSYGDGTSRGRLDSNAEERAARPPRCMPLATAEILPPENISTLGRIHVVGVQGYDLAVHDRIKANSDRLRRALSFYVCFLSHLDSLKVKELFEEKRKVVRDAVPTVTEGHPRLPENMALFLVAKELLLSCLNWAAERPLDEIMFPELEAKLMRGLRESAALQPTITTGTSVEELGEGTQRTAPAVQQFLTVLRTMLISGLVGLARTNQGQFTAPETLEPGERWIPKVGWHVEDQVWLHSEVAVDAVRRHLGGEWRWGNREFQSQIRPFLLETDGKNLAVKKYTSTGRRRVWVLEARVVLGDVRNCPVFDES